MTVDRQVLRLAARLTAGGGGLGVYFVVAPATGDLRRFEAAMGESDEETLTRAMGAAAPGDFVAVLRKGSLSRVWTAPAAP
jgi:hypothetical protein